MGKFEWAITLCLSSRFGFISYYSLYGTILPEGAAIVLKDSTSSSVSFFFILYIVLTGKGFRKDILLFKELKVEIVARID